MPPLPEGLVAGEQPPQAPQQTAPQMPPDAAQQAVLPLGQTPAAAATETPPAPEVPGQPPPQPAQNPDAPAAMQETEQQAMEPQNQLPSTEPTPDPLPAMQDQYQRQTQRRMEEASNIGHNVANQAPGDGPIHVPSVFGPMPQDSAAATTLNLAENRVRTAVAHRSETATRVAMIEKQLNDARIDDAAAASEVNEAYEHLVVANQSVGQACLNRAAALREQIDQGLPAQPVAPE